ncbi:MAG TPA: DUF2784 domain-containing protein [Acidimicrobiales bacterium]
MLDRLAADVVVAVHVVYLVFIPVGGFLAWRWPRLLPVHVAAVVVGLVSVTAGFDCPLTSWENWLRGRAGESKYREGFVDHYLTGRVYPHGHDAAVQLLIGAAVVVSYLGLYLRHRARERLVVTSSH